jgi:DNA polymerase-1
MLISPEKIPWLKEQLASASKGIAIDTETNITKRYHERYCIGISFNVDGGESFYLPVGHRDSWLGDTQNCSVDPMLLVHVRAPVLFFNAKFDIHVLKRAGLTIPEDFNYYDTMLMCHLIDENELQFSLDRMAMKYVGTGKWTELARIFKDIKWEDIPGAMMKDYAEVDALKTYLLYEAIKPMFADYEEVWNTDKRFLLQLQQIEERGIRVDLKEAEIQTNLCLSRMSQIRTELGFDPGRQKELHSKLFSPPPTGYGLKILSRTPTGKAQVNTKFLESTNHPVCGLLLENSKIKKLTTSYYNSYKELCEGYGRLHPSFKQHGTVTGRLSCADPNMQQIPRDSPIKKLFLPEPGKQLWEIDFRNIEMRLAAVYSKEPALLEIFRTEGDAHQLTADLLGISRQFAKVINFLIIYGGGKEALSYQLGIAPNKAARILDDYNNAYPRLYGARIAASNACISHGGWIRMWSAFNSIIQGGAFEIVKRAMLNLYAFDIRNQVHDSVWLMINEDNAEYEVKEAEHLMSSWTEETFNLPFTVESKRLA